MRQLISSNSVKAIWLDRDAVLREVTAAARRAVAAFEEIREVRLFGSFARGEPSSLSDVDLLVVVDRDDTAQDPIERTKPYFLFFSNHLGIAVDVLVAPSSRTESLEQIIGPSRVIASTKTL